MYMVESFLESLVSRHTRKSYKYGIKRFAEFYGKPAADLLLEEDPGKIIEKFYVWCRERYAQNSCRALVNPIIQYLKYNSVEPRIRKSLGIYRTTLTTRDHILSVDEAREMYGIGSLADKVMVKMWLLGLRISDACRLKWKSFDVSPSEDLIEVLVDTRKEGIVAHLFVDPELQTLLEKYIRNLSGENSYFFQSSRGDHLTGKQLLRKLQGLGKKAGIKAKGRFGWHIGRKLFLRTCAENGVTSWNAKLMVGKAVDKSIATYINHADLKKQARKVLVVLQMESTEPHQGIESLKEVVLQAEKDIHYLKVRLDLQRQFNEKLEKTNKEFEKRVESLSWTAEKYAELEKDLRRTREELESLNEFIAAKLVDSWNEGNYMSFLKEFYPELYERTLKEYEEARESIAEWLDKVKKEENASG